MTSLSHGRARHAQSSGLVVTLAIFGIGNGDAQSVLPGHFRAGTSCKQLTVTLLPVLKRRTL